MRKAPSTKGSSTVSRVNPTAPNTSVALQPRLPRLVLSSSAASASQKAVKTTPRVASVRPTPTSHNATAAPKPVPSLSFISKAKSAASNPTPGRPSVRTPGTQQKPAQTSTSVGRGKRENLQPLSSNHNTLANDEEAMNQVGLANIYIVSSSSHYLCGHGAAKVFFVCLFQKTAWNSVNQ
jgi:hypothetical protein